MEKVFRVSFKRCLKIGKSIGIGVAIAIFIGGSISDITNVTSSIDFFERIPFLVSISIGAGILSGLLIPALVFMVTLFYPVKIDSQSIRASKYSGVKATFTLYELQNVSKTTLYGIPYLVLENNSGSSIWIPELLKDQDELYDLIQNNTKIVNPEFSAFFAAFIIVQKTFN